MMMTQKAILNILLQPIEKLISEAISRVLLGQRGENRALKRYCQPPEHAISEMIKNYVINITKEMPYAI